MESNIIQITVRSAAGKEIEIEIDSCSNLKELRNKLKEKGESEIESQALKFKGKDLKGDETKLQDFKISNKSKLMAVASKKVNPKVQAVVKKEVPLERKRCEGPGCQFWG